MTDRSAPFVSPVLAAANLSKTYGGVRALRGMNIDVLPGELHALVGGNGSGKSTAIKILAGVQRGDAGGVITIGTFRCRADKVTAEAASAAGVHVVHQDLGVFLDLSVEENIALGRGYEQTRGGRIAWREVRKRTHALIERFGIRAAPETPLRLVGHATRTMVAIARALQDQDNRRSGVLILDEPTASLPEREVRDLLSTLRRYVSDGQSILYVSHRLDEVMAVADRITVLRDGVSVGTFPTRELNEPSLIRLILGQSLEKRARHAAARGRGAVRLAVEGLSAGPLDNVAFDVSKGEIVGVAGLLGAGRTELLRTLFGDLAIDRGRVMLDGVSVGLASSAKAMRAGIAYVPENRGEAAFPDLSLTDNISAAVVRSYWRRYKLDRNAARADCGVLLRMYKIRAHSEAQTLATLSGGNQQKVILARWLRKRPKVLLLDEPTQGVDVGARAQIHEFIRQSAATGTAVLVVASDLDELLQLADRVIVLCAGRLTADIPARGVTAHSLTQMAYARRPAACV